MKRLTMYERIMFYPHSTEQNGGLTSTI